MLLYKDGRIAQHPRFRYVTFNTIIRKQVNIRSGFFVLKISKDSDISINNLRYTFKDNSLQSEAILNSIIRFAGSLRGTRPFWVGKGRALKAIVGNFIFLRIS